jgi:hypothetical protein
MSGMSFQNSQIADEVKCLVLHRHNMAGVGVAGLGLRHFVHRRPPSAVRHFGVGGRQIRPGDLQIQDGLAVGFVLGMKQCQSLGLGLRAQTNLFAGGRVFGVKNSGSPKHDET